MASITNRSELRDYILYKLGFPVVEINVADEQIDIVIEEALEYCKEFHDDFVERLYLKHVVTGTTIKLSTATANSFTVGETVVGANGSFVVHDAPSSDTLRTTKITGTIANGESLTGSTSGFIATTAALNAVVIGDIQRGYISMPNNTESVIRVLPMRSVSRASDYIFDIKYQFIASDILNVSKGNLLYYHISMDYLAEIDFQYNELPDIKFNRYTERLTINWDWESEVEIDSIMVIEGYFVVNPDTFFKIFNDRLFKELCVAMTQKQWGMNTKKYSEILLPGGIRIRGEEMYQEGLEEEARIKQEVKDHFQSPPMPFMG